VQNADVLDGISRLADSSLLSVAEDGRGETRFRMLEVVRDYAGTCLTPQEGDAVERSHAAYFLALAETAEQHLQGDSPAEWVERLDAEHDNVRAAIHSSLERDPATATRIAAAVRYFWDFRGYLTEGLWTAKKVLAKSAAAPATARWKLLTMAGNMSRFQADYETARAMYQQAMDEAIQARDLRQISLSCRGLAGLAVEQENYSQARSLILRALSASRRVNDDFGIARSLNMLGDLARVGGEDVAACSLFEDALQICRRLKNRHAVSNILINLGAAEYGRADYAAAHQRFTEAAAMMQTHEGRIVGDRIGVSHLLDGFAALAFAGNDFEVAATLAGAAEALRQKINFRSEPAERKFREAYLSRLRAAMPEDDFTSAYQRGCDMKLEESVASATKS
jgi:tetratricopeptide (TPR) repeat protein